jgi:hypothetical protein
MAVHPATDTDNSAANKKDVHLILLVMGSSLQMIISFQSLEAQ